MFALERRLPLGRPSSRAQALASAQHNVACAEWFAVCDPVCLTHIQTYSIS